MRNQEVRGKCGQASRGAALTGAIAILGLLASASQSAGQTPGPCDAPNTCTLWPNTQVPATPAANDSSPVELGVRFQATVDGYVTAIRFYKSAANTGSHIVNLWTSGGTLLAQTNATNETPSGWQEVALPNPVQVFANTTYIASYHTNVGAYAIDSGYFTTEFSNGVLKALQDAPGGHNGLFGYGGSGFPTGSFQAANYWVDIAFATSLLPDTTAPQLQGTVPSDAAKNVSVSTAISATFSESIDLATLTGANFQVRDPNGALVAGQLTYTSVTRTAKFQPNGLLANSATYTATVRGGASGIKDLAGNALPNDVVWTFKTKGPSPPPPTTGPGGPVLVVKSSSNPFTVYYAEILRAEGLNEFAVADLNDVSATTLRTYDAVILGEQSLTDAQVAMFSDWVTAGGNLIAMRPDKKLATLLGLADTGTLLPEGYIKVDTSAAPGSGIVGQTMQFHGNADLYTLNGATAVATLYASSSAVTPNPAVTVRSIGSAGGQAAAFTYDLARSVVYTRQGNPAWSGQARDGFPTIRSDDLFFPDYIDLSKVAIPQADEQQRLLANLIQFLNRDLKPLPRFWYFPRGLKAVVVMTGDDHGTNGTEGRFSIYSATSTAGCAVDNWECIRATSYIYPSTPIAPQTAAAYAAQGFEIAAHITTNCANYDAASLDSAFAAQRDLFTANFPDLPSFATNRTHCVVWSDYDTQPQTELAHEVRLDTTYYYWPDTWVNDVPGLFTGSGLPQRFAKADGTMIDVYQAPTQMTDESGQSYPFHADVLLDNALNQGYYGSFVANMHTDLAVHAGSAAILASAKQRGVPIISAQQLLDWTDGRNASSFSDITWSGTSLSFKVNLWSSGTQGIQAMVPTTSPAGAFVGALKDGVQIEYTIETVKGIDYARFFAPAGTYEVRYGIDNLPPVISALTAAPASNSAAIAWHTNEPATTQVIYGLSPTQLIFTKTTSGLDTSHAVTLTGLVSATTYYYRVISADAFNNLASAPSPNGTFATGTPAPLSLVDTTVADFTAGSRDGGLSIGHLGDGELLLVPTAVGEFSGSTLPAGWSVSPWTPGGSATVGGGRVVVEGALLGTDASYNSGTVEFVATFSGNPFQHIGVGTDFNNPPFAIFSTGGFGGALYARTNNGSVSAEDVLPAALLNGLHRFRIDWSATGVAYWIDGTHVANHAVPVSQPLRLLISDGALDGGSVAVNWIRSSPYPTTSVFTSRVMDAQGSMTWANVSWTASVPDGTALSLSARFGNTVTPDTTWTAYVPLPASGPLPTPLPTSRFVQYQAAFSGDGTATPVLENVAFTANSSGPSISVADTTVNEGNSGTSPSATFTLKLSSPMGVPVSVSYATVDGTATAADYVATSGTATFSPGQTSVQVSVPIKGDLLVEGNQTFFLILTNPLNAAISDPQAVCTIIDNDVAQLSISNTSVIEGDAGGSTATFTVSLTNPLEQQTVTVDYSTTDGTATSNTDKPDYMPASGTLTFAPGEVQKTVLVSVLGDTLNEANETFLVKLANAVNATIKTAQATGTITNDDPVVSVNTVAELKVTEGTNGTTIAQLPVSLSAASGQTVSVTYSMKDVTTDKDDYDSTTGTLTFAPGVTLQNINISINGDALYEPDETFILTLKSPVNASLARTDIPVTIVNDDPLPQLSITTASVTEGNSGTVNANFTVSLTNPSSTTITVKYATADGTALAASDYNAVSGTLTFSPGQTTKTVTVQVRGDTVNENDETFTVALTAPVGAGIAAGAGVGTGTIINDDFLPSLQITGVTVTETNPGATASAVLNVTLTAPSTSTVTVKYATSPGTATSGVDYTATSGTLSFAPGQTSKTVPVTVLGDLVDEPDETFNVDLSAPVNATLANSRGVVTIVDDDPPPSISMADISIAEGKSGNTTATFTLTLSSASARDVTVSYATADGTATLADGDYLAISGTATFAAGATSAKVFVTVRGDSKVEPNETVLLNLTNAVNATIAKTQGILTITNDDK